MQAQVKSMMFAIASVAAVSLFAGDREYSDAEIKAQFMFAGRCRHAEDMKSNYDWAFRMADGDTNRYARILRELAVENTNETEWAIASLGKYKTTQSLPFLYFYSTNAVYGAEALKSIFAIEGVTSNSVAATESYLMITNYMPPLVEYNRSELCESLLKKVYATSGLEHFREPCITMAVEYARSVSTMHQSLDMALMEVDPSYRFSRRRLSVMRLAQNRCWNTMLTNYVTNAINELVAYPEASLPD